MGTQSESDIGTHTRDSIIPAEAGIQEPQDLACPKDVDSRIRGNDNPRVAARPPHRLALLLEHRADPTIRFPPGTYAGNWLDVSASQTEAENNVRVKDAYPHLRFPSVSEEELAEKHNLIPVGGMTPLEVAEKIGAEAAATSLRRHLKKE